MKKALSPSNKAPSIIRQRSVITLLFSLGLISAFVYYIYANRDKYLGVLRLSPWPVILIFLLSLASPFFNGTINTYMFRGLGANFSFREGFLLASVSTLANQLPVSGGIIAKGVYLKHKHDLSYTKYFSSTLALFFCTVAVNGLLGMFILLYWVVFQKIMVSAVLFIGFGGMAAGLAFFAFPFDRIQTPRGLLKYTHQAVEGWRLISKNAELLLKLLVLQTGLMLFLAARYWLAFHMLSQNVTVGQVILFSSASILTQLVSFAPGGLGVREAIVGTTASALGFDAGISVVAVGLDRLISTVMIMLTGWASTIILGREFSEKRSIDLDN